MGAPTLRAVSDEEHAAILEQYRSASDRHPASGAEPPERPVERLVTVVEPVRVHYTEAVRAGLWDRRGPGWQVYARELPRLLAEGHEGRYVLVGDDGSVSLYDTHLDAHQAWAGGRAGQIILVSEWHPLNRLAPLIKRCRDSSSAPTPTA
jgi:hypothetical protein